MGTLADHEAAALEALGYSGSIADMEILFWAAMEAGGGAIYRNETYDAAGDDAQTSRVTGDTNPRFTLNADGKLEWGPGNAALDTNLFRSSANTLKTQDIFRSDLDIVSRDGSASRTDIGAVGPGSEAGIKLGQTGDTNLYRSAANELKTDDTFLALLNIAARYGAATEVLLGAVGPSSEAGLRFGSAGDTNLYRLAANVLATDDRLDINANDLFIQSGAATRMRLGARGPAGEAGIIFGNLDDTNLYRSAADTLRTDDDFTARTIRAVVDSNGNSFFELREQSADPAAAPADRGRLFCKDNGAGKTQLAVRFATGAVQIIATEP